MDMLPCNVYNRQKWIEELQERIDKIRGKELGFYLTIAEAADIMFVLKEADDSIQGYKETQLKGLELEHEILALKIKENERIQCMQYHFGFQFGIACAIVDVVPDISNKEVAFQNGFKGGLAAADACMELRVCSRLGIKEFTKSKNRTRRFTHEPKIEGRSFNDRIEKKAPKTGTRSKARRANR